MQPYSSDISRGYTDANHLRRNVRKHRAVSSSEITGNEIHRRGRIKSSNRKSNIDPVNFSCAKNPERTLNSSNNEQSGELKLKASHKWAHERGERIIWATGNAAMVLEQLTG